MRKSLYPAGGNDLRIETITLEGGRRVMLHPRDFGITQMVAAGEQSEWMLALKEKAVIIGGRCRKCGQLYAPLYLELCGNSDCRFEKLVPFELPDVGYMAAKPVVTLFAPARMNGEAPFAHGLVYLDNGIISATTAMMFAMDTTTGVIRNGIYGHDTKVKLVFNDERFGEITDVRAFPVSELTEEQMAKSPLFMSDLKLSEPEAPVYEESPEAKGLLETVLNDVANFLNLVNQSTRVFNLLAKSNSVAKFVTPGGSFSVNMIQGNASLSMPASEKTDVTFVTQDITAFHGWTKGEALTNLFALGSLWISNRGGVRFLENMDRLHRAACCDGIITA